MMFLCVATLIATSDAGSTFAQSDCRPVEIVQPANIEPQASFGAPKGPNGAQCKAAPKTEGCDRG